MHRTIFWLTWLAFYLFFRLPAKWKAIRLGKQGRYDEQKEYVDRKVKQWTSALLKNIGMELTVEGRENIPPKDKAVMFVSNHQSYLDIPVLLDGLGPNALLAKGELGKVPLLSGWMNLLGCLYVDRDDMRSSLDILRKGQQMLESGKSLIVCPEGTRSKSDTMAEFKPGAVRMAYKAGVPIVPVAIDGTWRAFEGNQNKLVKCKVRLVVLPEVSTKDLSRDEQRGLAAKLEDMVRAAKDNRPE